MSTADRNRGAGTSGEDLSVDGGVDGGTEHEANFQSALGAGGVGDEDNFSDATGEVVGGDERTGEDRALELEVRRQVLVVVHSTTAVDHVNIVDEGLGGVDGDRGDQVEADAVEGDVVLETEDIARQITSTTFVTGVPLATLNVSSVHGVGDVTHTDHVAGS